MPGSAAQGGDKDIASASDASAAKRSWMIFSTGLLVWIWVAVLVISLFAPDLVSGSEQQHLPLAAMIAWIWGAVGTAAVLWTMGSLRGDVTNRPIWVGYSAVVALIWLVATVLALVLPAMETGTDPTTIPLAAIFAPLVASVMTGLGGLVAIGFSRDHDWD